MIDETLKQLQARIQDAPSIRDEKKTELLTLIGSLKDEIDELAGDHRDVAESITGFAGVSAHEATRERPQEGLIEVATQGLRDSVEEFEATHPRLVEIVHQVSTTLSNMGI